MSRLTFHEFVQQFVFEIRWRFVFLCFQGMRPIRRPERSIFSIFKKEFYTLFTHTFGINASLTSSFSEREFALPLYCVTANLQKNHLIKEEIEPK